MYKIVSALIVVLLLTSCSDTLKSTLGVGGSKCQGEASIMHSNQPLIVPPIFDLPPPAPLSKSHGMQDKQ